MMPKLPLTLRILLFFINIGTIDPKKPLNKTRAITNWFMGLCNRWFGLRTTNFYSITGSHFVAAEGHTINLKIYTPIKTDQPLPVWVYFHGGGFAHGYYTLRSNFCKAIAAQVGCIVVSVQYRLAPEHPFPAGVNDCYEATKWISENAASFGGDGSKIAVGGESAGGNFATCVSMMARDKGTPKILHETLLYPAVDVSSDYPSIDKFATGYMLTKDLMENFLHSYIPNSSDWTNPYCSPLKGDLHGLPPALLITAGYDPLSDQGRLYAEKLKQQGIPTVYKHYPNMIHDFIMLMTRVLPEARDSVALTVQEVRKSFYGG